MPRLKFLAPAPAEKICPGPGGAIAPAKNYGPGPGGAKAPGIYLGPGPGPRHALDFLCVWVESNLIVG